MSGEGSEDERDREGARVLHAARVNAWFATRMEFDKTVLGLSTFGLGLWRFMLEALREAPVVMRACHGGMAVAFLAAVVCVLLIFRQNSRVLEGVIGGDPDTLKRENSKAKWLDTGAAVFFLLGLFFFVAVGFYMAWHQADER